MSGVAPDSQEFRSCQERQEKIPKCQEIRNFYKIYQKKFKLYKNLLKGASTNSTLCGRNLSTYEYIFLH